MKKITVLVAGLRPQLADAWQTDEPGLVAWNNPGNLEYDGESYKVKTTWQLLQVAEYPFIGRVGYHVCSTYKRDEVVDIARILGDLGKWDLPWHELDTDLLAQACERITEWWSYRLHGREAA